MSLQRVQRSAVIALLGGLTLTVGIAHWAAGVGRHEASQAFQQKAEATLLRLRDGLGDYDELLHGLRGFFAGSSEVDRAEFHRYLASLQVAARHPGVQTVAFARHLPASERERFVSRVRADRSIDPAGYPRFAIHPANAAATESLVNDYTEPMAGNEAAFGLDLNAESERREAAIRARDTGELAATAPIRLAQETSEQSGYVLMLPIYRTGAPLSTVDDRRRAFVGVVHAAFRAQDMVGGVLGAALQGVGLQITDDGPSAGPPSADAAEQPVADALPAELPARRLLDLALPGPGPLAWREFRFDYAGRVWQVRIGAAEPGGGWALPSAILAGGVLTSLLLAAFLQSLAGARARAETLAERMTRDLRALATDNQAILDHTLDAIVTIDEIGHIESFNRAAERLFGHSAADVHGRNVKLLMPEPFAGAHDGYLKAYRDSGQRRIIGIGREVVGRRADGSTFPMELAVSEVVVNERRRFIGMVRDITERKRVEQLKNEFVSTISHELRTPLTSIRGSLGLVEGGVAGELPAQARLLVGIAAKNCERLVRLINEILDIEKIESGKMHFDVQAHALMPLIEHAVDATQGFAAQHGTRYAVTERVDDGRVRVDADRFAQVLTNLLSNAAKYAPPESVVEVAATRHHGTLRIAVRDRGAGIPPEFQARIFEKFSQADGSTTRERGGSGLGLSIAKAMVEHMGGQIGFESVPGEGSCFWFSLPAIDRPSTEPDLASAPATVEASIHATAVAHPPPAPNRPLRPRVLHVEDDADLGHFVTALLADLAEVVVVPTLAAGRQALDAGARGGTGHRYDLLILDPGLPDGSGFDLLPTVKALPYALPVVVFSAFEAAPDRADESIIAAVLVKSRTSNERFQDIVRHLTATARSDIATHQEST